MWIGGANWVWQRLSPLDLHPFGQRKIKKNGSASINLKRAVDFVDPLLPLILHMLVKTPIEGMDIELSLYMHKLFHGLKLPLCNSMKNLGF